MCGESHVCSRRTVLDAPLPGFPIAIPSHASRPRARRPLSSSAVRVLAGVLCVMKKLKFHYIKTTKFQAAPGEDKEVVNEGMYGRLICEYLKGQLASLGFQTFGCYSEDWGWYLEIGELVGVNGLCVYSECVDNTVVGYVLGIEYNVVTKWKWIKLKSVEINDVETERSLDRISAAIRNVFINAGDVQYMGEFSEFPI